MSRQLRLYPRPRIRPCMGSRRRQQTQTQTQTHFHSYFMGPKLLCVCLAFHTNFFLASLPLVGSVTKGPSQRADQLSRGLSRNESLSNKQSTWWSGRTGRKKSAKNTHTEGKKTCKRRQKFTHALSICTRNNRDICICLGLAWPGYSFLARAGNQK